MDFTCVVLPVLIECVFSRSRTAVLVSNDSNRVLRKAE
jgi:hypothetical protein